MKRLLFLFATLLMCVTTMQAQDLLIKQNGEEIEVLVREIDSANVKYVLFSEPNGVLYVVPKSEVLLIHYASGRKEVFTDAALVAEPTMQEPQQQNMEVGDRFIVDYGGGSRIHIGMKYAQLKNIYNHKDWRGGYDKYSPGWSAVGSFFIPGLGQMCCNEFGRGMTQLGANVGLGLLSTIAIANDDMTAFAIYYASRVVLGVWSIVDAVRVAKVKNMYENDMLSHYYHSSVSVDVYPSLNCVPQQGSPLKVAPGITMALTF